MSEQIYIFKIFERIWHWGQAGLIIFLMITGFEVHGLYSNFGFEKAVNLHTIGAWSLIGLWCFAIFWHLTTGEWKQYIPSTKNVMAMANYYLTPVIDDQSGRRVEVHWQPCTLGSLCVLDAR